MIDNDILVYFSQWKRIPWKRIDKDIKNYLENRYSDSLSIQESYLRIKYNIENRPICPVCGKPVKFYGKETIKIFLNHCSTKCSSLDKNIQNKSKKTKLDKYGNENYNNSNKIKNTCLLKYGVNNVFNIPKFRKNNKISLNSLETINKRKETCLKKYGNENILSYYYSYNLINTKLIKIKEYYTKKQNHTFNVSKLENESYQLLKEKYHDIEYQYKSKEYPFSCDFYIPSLDLYIECNYHWTHGGKIFEGTEEDQNQLNKWKEKNTKYYNNAINTWTIRDPIKRKIAKENNLNYIEFWNLKELINWINLK